MAEYALPFDGQSITEGEWQRMARHWLAPGVVSGHLNGLQVSAGSGMTVNVATGAAWAVGFVYETTGIVTTTLAAAHATLPRVDRVVVRLDRTANTFTVANITGTAGASPTAPALTQTDTVYEVPLATVAVAAATGSIIAANITDARVFTGNARQTLEQLVEAKGDLLAATSGDAVARLPVGSTGLALVADPAASTGLGWARQYSPTHVPPLSQVVMSTTETNSALFNTSAYVETGLTAQFIAGPAGTALVDVRAVTFINTGNADAGARLGFALYNVTGSSMTVTAGLGTTVEFQVSNQPSGNSYILPAVAFAFPVSGLTAGSTYEARVVAFGAGGWYALSQQILVTY